MQIKKGSKFRVEHNKKLFYVIIVLIVLFILWIFYVVNNWDSGNVDKRNVGDQDVEGVGGEVGYEDVDGGELECSLDSDCVAETCCHASSCVAVSEAPDCSNIMCTMECAPGTMDCGQGYCGCVNGKCESVFD